MYIDEVKHIMSENVRFHVYADDVKIVKRIRDYDDCVALQAVLNDFSVWTEKMGLSLSVNKCGVLRIGSGLPVYE